MFRTIQQVFFGSYGYFDMIVEIAVIWACVYLVFRFLKGTRGAGIVKGFVVLVVVVTLLIKVFGQNTDTLGRLNFIYDRFLGLIAILLIVVFQPELRQFMIRLGHARFFRQSSSEVTRVVDAVSEAVDLLSKSQFGALIAIERSIGLSGLFEGGDRMDAVVSGRLLGSIFWPNSPLHDLGVVIRGHRILAANVQFPLAEEGSVPQHHGSRHRAAVGVTLESDCIAVVVSEETGSIALVEQGVVEANVPIARFRELLQARLEGPPGGGSSGTSEPARPAKLARPKVLSKKLASRPAVKHSAALAEES
ncbi:MAG: TIGR00159 family protein [Planctomycetota bacterium]|nr:MAG: TIGR00159 family protein [Planctomycetota bacterium]